MSRAASLWQLQTIDSELDSLRARLESIAAALGDDPAVRRAQQEAQDADGQLHRARSTVQNLDFDGQNLNEKIAEISQRMYGGGNLHPKELQDLARDLESLKRRRGALEEQQFEALMAAEAAEGRQKAAREALGQAEAALAQNHASLREERQRLEAGAQRLSDRREAALASILTQDAALYERLRASKRGRAVAQLEEGACTGCGVAPSSSRIQTARRNDDLIVCGNCGRILSAD